jgi:hypothetical protein
MRHSIHRGAAIAAAALVLALPVFGATVYRWVDEQGRVHFSDVVPEKYRNTARPVDAPAAAPSMEQRREAAERAARDKARADQAAKERESRQTPAPGPAPAASASAKRPPAAPDESTNCETWRRLYRESLECFAPYRTARGGTKAEAFEHCTPVLEPPVRCGRNSR